MASLQREAVKEQKKTEHRASVSVAKADTNKKEVKADGSKSSPKREHRRTTVKLDARILVKNSQKQAAEDNEIKPGIQISRINKIYPSESGPVIALHDLTLEFHENEIVVLLGHNGAGILSSTATPLIINGLL